MGRIWTKNFNRVRADAVEKNGKTEQEMERDVESENRGRERKWMDGVRKERQGQPRW